MESWYSAEITGTEVPDVDDSLVISGAQGDWWYETVEVVSYTAGTPDHLILLTDDGIGDDGDSEAPVYNWSTDNFVGTVLGGATITINGVTDDYVAVVPWSEISNSSTGLGVSLL